VVRLLPPGISPRINPACLFWLVHLTPSISLVSNGPATPESRSAPSLSPVPACVIYPFSSTSAVERHSLRHPDRHRHPRSRESGNPVSSARTWPPLSRGVGGGPVSYSGALQASELLGNSRPAVRDRRYSLERGLCHLHCTALAACAG
jgi:hypothetical protein